MKDAESKQPTVTTILTAYKREYLFRQLERIQKQTWAPKEIIVWQNGDYLTPYVSDTCKRFEVTNHVHSHNNYKFHGRFLLPLLLDTDFVAIFDDDCMPGPKWLQTCLETHNRFGGIVGANGRNFDQSGRQQGGPCDGFYSDVPVRYDIVGHCWFFPTHWIRDFWATPVYTFENGEDIHLCASLNIARGVIACVPAQPASDPDCWGDSTPGIGDTPCAAHKNPDHNNVRRELYEHFKVLGWQTRGHDGIWK